jgi:hypothetical protein
LYEESFHSKFILSSSFRDRLWLWIDLTTERRIHGRELADFRCGNFWGGGYRYRGLQEGSTKAAGAPQGLLKGETYGPS